MHLPGLVVEQDLVSLPWRSTRVRGVDWLPVHELSRVAKESRGSGARGAATVLIRMAPGASYGAHRHVGTEDVLVLQGGYQDESGTHRRGDVVHYEAGSVHAPRALGDPERPASRENPACVLLAVAPGGIELLGR